MGVLFLNLNDCMEKADSKDHLLPVQPQSVLFKEIVRDLCEGSTNVGTQTLRRFICHLEALNTAKWNQ